MEKIVEQLFLSRNFNTKAQQKIELLHVSKNFAFSLMFSIKILLVQPNCNLKLGLSHYFCTLDMFDDEHENRFPFKIDE
jgi:hypothetical protein